MLLYEYTYFQEIDRRDTRTATLTGSGPMRCVAVTTAATYIYFSASAVLLLILMLPLLRYEYSTTSRTGTNLFSSEDTIGCAACCDLTGIATLRYIRVQYGFLS